MSNHKSLLQVLSELSLVNPEEQLSKTDAKLQADRALGGQGFKAKATVDLTADEQR